MFSMTAWLRQIKTKWAWKIRPGRAGDYRRAAFIYGKLLQDYRLAADVLARGGLYHDAAVIYLENIVSLYTERWPTILGVAFIVIMIFAPEGILGKLQALQRNRSK